MTRTIAALVVRTSHSPHNTYVYVAQPRLFGHGDRSHALSVIQEDASRTKSADSLVALFARSESQGG